MNEQLTLSILLGEFYDKLGHLADLIPRDAQFPHAPTKIKVAIGMRRVGKTYFLYQQILNMLEHGVPRNAILYINFEDDRLAPLNEHRLAQLVDAFYALYPENHDRKCYLFFDEIQNVNNWSTVVRRLHDTKNAEIFLTGSSSKLLSKEIATSLRGRSLAIEIWPYSFHEYMRAKHISIDQSLYDKKAQDRLKKTFIDYLADGGFPEVLLLESDVQRRVLQDYLNIAMYRDILERHQIKKSTALKHMILAMTHNVGKPFSVSKFYNALKSQGHAISKDALYEYLDHIEEAYLAFAVSLYDQSLRKVHANPKKVYAIDPGMVRASTLKYEDDLGRLFENVVYLDLRRLGYTVNYYLTSERYAVDFLAHTARGQKKLFQVAWDVQNAETLAREERALQAAMGELKIDGELITLDSYLQHGISW